MTYVVAEAEKDTKARCPTCRGQCKVKNNPYWNSHRDFCWTCNNKGWLWKSEITFMKLKGEL